ncbi:Helitron helicase [Phytophthora megakarya]|uniref:Helitron helicase n=1 Tax=Phytophthora megakarya TaxID=4795 RepID=A0A225WIL1_9STRA|nr:Helitron helicase [Phytophthora megakarya]
MVRVEVKTPTASAWSMANAPKGARRLWLKLPAANADGYAEVQRRRRPHGKLKFETDENNNWVVPYNPYLPQTYNCHINIEICTGITVVKYMYK